MIPRGAHLGPAIAAVAALSSPRVGAALPLSRRDDGRGNSLRDQCLNNSTDFTPSNPIELKCSPNPFSTTTAVDGFHLGSKAFDKRLAGLCDGSSAESYGPFIIVKILASSTVFKDALESTDVCDVDTNKVGGQKTDNGPMIIDLGNNLQQYFQNQELYGHSKFSGVEKAVATLAVDTVKLFSEAVNNPRFLVGQTELTSKDNLKAHLPETLKCAVLLFMARAMGDACTFHHLPALIGTTASSNLPFLGLRNFLNSSDDTQIRDQLRTIVEKPENDDDGNIFSGINVNDLFGKICDLDVVQFNDIIGTLLVTNSPIFIYYQQDILRKAPKLMEDGGLALAGARHADATSGQVLANFEVLLRDFFRNGLELGETAFNFSKIGTAPDAVGKDDVDPSFIRSVSGLHNFLNITLDEIDPDGFFKIGNTDEGSQGNSLKTIGGVSGRLFAFIRHYMLPMLNQLLLDSGFDQETIDDQIEEAKAGIDSIKNTQSETREQAQVPYGPYQSELGNAALTVVDPRRFAQPGNGWLPLGVAGLGAFALPKMINWYLQQTEYPKELQKIFFNARRLAWGVKTENRHQSGVLVRLNPKGSPGNSKIGLVLKDKDDSNKTLKFSTGTDNRTITNTFELGDTIEVYDPNGNMEAYPADVNKGRGEENDAKIVNHARAFLIGPNTTEFPTGLVLDVMLGGVALLEYESPDGVSFTKVGDSQQPQIQKLIDDDATRKFKLTTNPPEPLDSLLTQLKISPTEENRSNVSQNVFMLNTKDVNRLLPEIMMEEDNVKQKGMLDKLIAAGQEYLQGKFKPGPDKKHRVVFVLDEAEAGLKTLVGTTRPQEGTAGDVQKFEAFHTNDKSKTLIEALKTVLKVGSEDELNEALRKHYPVGPYKKYCVAFLSSALPIAAMVLRNLDSGVNNSGVFIVKNDTHSLWEGDISGRNVSAVYFQKYTSIESVNPSCTGSNSVANCAEKYMVQPGEDLINGASEKPWGKDNALIFGLTPVVAIGIGLILRCYYGDSFQNKLKWIMSEEQPTDILKRIMSNEQRTDAQSSGKATSFSATHILAFIAVFGGFAGATLVGNMAERGGDGVDPNMMIGAGASASVGMVAVFLFVMDALNRINRQALTGNPPVSEQSTQQEGNGQNDDDQSESLSDGSPVPEQSTHGVENGQNVGGSPAASSGGTSRGDARAGSPVSEQSTHGVENGQNVGGSPAASLTGQPVPAPDNQGGGNGQNDDDQSQSSSVKSENFSEISSRGLSEGSKLPH